jgi:endonuclease-8
MEGPSLVIAREEMSTAIGHRVLRVRGNSTQPIASLKGQKLLEIGAWGKHFLLFFEDATLKIHFLLWGTYRVDEKKGTQKPRLHLHFKNIDLYFYSCSIRFLEEDVDSIYDWSADTMSPSWDSAKALKKILEKPREMVCDVLMDQAIFSGVGNIIKNEVLFRLLLHPEHRVGKLNRKQLRKLVEEAHIYSWQFYEWKKAYQLKKHWLIMRKKTCPRCNGSVTRRETGKRQRLSHFCPRCQQ